MVKLSIVIVSWNTADILVQCLESVFAHAPEAPFEVWVVDNASHDGSPERVRQEFPQVKLLANRENGGFAAGNNQAIRQATGAYVLLLNPDTIVYAGALQTLVDYLDDNPEVGACGSRVLNADGSLQESCYVAPTLGREVLRMFHLDGRIRYRMETWDRQTARAVDALLGACILARREILLAIGLMDEGYFMFSEEIDLCYRIRQAGWGVHYVPWAEIVHLGGQSTQQVKTAMFLQLYAGKVRYMRKHYGRLQAALYKIILWLAALPRLVLVAVAWVESSPRKEAHRALAGRYWQLVRVLPGY
jgi:GT2 family glycosyltransferase